PVREHGRLARRPARVLEAHPRLPHLRGGGSRAAEAERARELALPGAPAVLGALRAPAVLRYPRTPRLGRRSLPRLSSIQGAAIVRFRHRRGVGEGGSAGAGATFNRPIAYDIREVVDARGPPFEAPDEAARRGRRDARQLRRRTPRTPGD